MPCLRGSPYTLPQTTEGAVDGVHADGGGQVHALVGTTDVPGHGRPRQRLLDARQTGNSASPGGSQFFRRWYPGSDEAFDREHRVGAGAAVVLDVAITEFPEERWLHRRYDVLRADAVAKIGRADGTVFNAVA